VIYDLLNGRFQLPRMAPSPDFKGIPLFKIVYLKTVEDRNIVTM